MRGAIEAGVTEGVLREKIRKRRVKPARWPVDVVELLLEDRRKR